MIRSDAINRSVSISISGILILTFILSNTVLTKHFFSNFIASNLIFFIYFTWLMFAYVLTFSFFNFFFLIFAVFIKLLTYKVDRIFQVIKLESDFNLSCLRCFKHIHQFFQFLCIQLNSIYKHPSMLKLSIRTSPDIEAFNRLLSICFLAHLNYWIDH